MRLLLLVSLVVIASVAVASSKRSRAKITVWSAPAPAAGYGGFGYGGPAAPTGALITQEADVEVTASGETRLGGVATTADPASVQVRDLTDPAATVVEQRFTPAAATPTAAIARHVGSTVVAVTPKGDVTGVLRSVDARAIVLETGPDDQRRLQVLRRDYVQDLRLPPGPGSDRGSLALHLATRRAGTHTLELSYRASGMRWTADYVAVLDDKSSTVDFTAWASIENKTGASFDAAELVLLDGSKPPTRYVIAEPVKLATDQRVQVPLVPAQRAAPTKTVVLYEAIPDLSPGFQTYANTDCAQYNANTGPGSAELALEVALPTKDPLPVGRVQLFRRSGARIDVVSEEPLRSRPGAARIRIDRTTDLVGDRKAVSCTNDEKARTLTERVELVLENKGKRALDVVVREFAWRWPIFKLDAEAQKSVKGGAQAFEYRVALPAQGKRTLSYTVVYAW